MILFILSAAIICTFSLPKLIIHETEMFGNISLGYYYIFLEIGTPAQKQSFIVDTGSQVFATPCMDCIDCGNQHISPRFDHNKSTTVKLLTCSTGQGLCQRCFQKQAKDSCLFNTSFVQQSSLKGYLLQDKVMLSSNNSTNTDQGVQAVFGCITNQTNLFQKQKADGLLGLSPNSNQHLVKQFYRNHYGSSKQNFTFSICLSDNGGVFTIGGLNKRLHANHRGINLRYRKNANTYSLNITGVNIGDTKLNITKQQIQNSYGIFLDSGATYTYFPYKHYATIISQFQEICLSLGCKSYKGHNTQCFIFPSSKSYSLNNQLNKFPPIILNANRQDKLQWHSYQYFFAKNISNREVCLQFTQLDRFLLGTTWMMYRDIQFDLNKQQINIYESTCEFNMTAQQQKQKQQQIQQSQQQQSENDKKAFIITIIIIAIFFIVAIFLIITCKRRIKNKQLSESSSLTFSEPPSQQYHDEISMTDISQDNDNSSRNI